MLESKIDIIMTVLFVIGLTQLAWFSVMLLRKNISAEAITTSLAPFISIWVLLWPLYESPSSIWAGIVILAVPALLSYSNKHLFLQHLRIAWSGTLPAKEQSNPLPHLWSFASLIAALAIAASFFQRAPEFGLGIGLATCLAFPAASLLDKVSHLKLGFPLHQEQTLIGHIGFIIFVSTISMWSIHTYHGIEWQRLLIATLIAGMIASVTRAFSPSPLMMPLATLLMGTTLWLL